MQIPSSAIAASLSTAISNTKTERTAGTETVNNSPIQLEKSGESSADRDAQGQGDGMGPRNSRKKNPGNDNSEPIHSDLITPAPNLPDEPPSQLDLVG